MSQMYCLGKRMFATSVFPQLGALEVDGTRLGFEVVVGAVVGEVVGLGVVPVGVMLRVGAEAGLVVGVEVAQSSTFPTRSTSPTLTVAAVSTSQYLSFFQLGLGLEIPLLTTKAHCVLDVGGECRL